jgi:hypothetical protein
MKHEFSGHDFDFIARIEPERDSSGAIREFMPQSHYRNIKNLPLNRHGSGPFCQFRIRSNLPLVGVYVVTVNGEVAYVGECQNLSERFNARGYGTIHPRNCFEGGQPTNCKINNLMLQESKLGRKLELWFRETDDRKSLEAKLIRELRPPWNTQLRW